MAAVRPTVVASTTKKSNLEAVPAPMGKIGAPSESGKTMNSSASATGATSIG